MRSVLPSPAGVLLAALLGLAACSKAEKIPGCSTRADCAAAEVCQGGFCLPDRTPPTVVDHLPAADAVNVWWNDPVVVDFDEPIDPSSITDSSLVVTDPASVQLARSFVLDGSRLQVRLSQPPADPGSVRFTLTLGSQIHDMAGNALRPVVWGWELPAWQEPAPPFNQGVGGALVLSHAVAPDGGIFMAWQDSYPAGSPPQVKLAASGSWTGFGGPSRTGAAYLVGTSMAVGADGHPILAYAPRSSFSGPATLYVDRHDGNAWAPLGGALNADPARSAKGPRLRIDSSGRPVVLWAETVGTVDHLFARRWNGSAWEDLGGETPTDASRSAAAYALAAGPGGALSLAYADGASIALLRYGGTGWQSPGLGLATTAAALDLAFDGGGVEVVAYADASGLQAARWKQGGPGNFVALGGALAASGTNPSVAFRAGGRPGQQLLVGWAGGLAGWDGASWVPVAGPPGGTLSVNSGGVLGSVWADSVAFETKRVSVLRFNR